MIFGLLNEKKNEEDEGEKYLAREMKHREGKEGNIWRGKISYPWRRRKAEKEKEEDTGRRKAS